MRRRLLLAAPLAGILLAVPAAALAHPLGNFTINHYAGLTVTPEAVQLDVVIDMAEIPTFQERIRIDADEDGYVSDGEAAAAAPADCVRLAGDLELVANGRAVALSATSSTLSFPSGLGGLSTLRLECGFVARIAPLTATTAIEFSDGSFAARIGWREIVVTGLGVAVDAGEIPSTSTSARLTDYPDDLIDEPLDVRSASILATPDAGSGGAPPLEAGADAAVSAGAVPGGVASAEVPSVFRAADLTPLVLLVSIVTALGLGAVHALTPGHGKTLMAAYLVGTRGRPLHAVGLGLAVSVSHTIGILALAALVVGGQGLLPAEAVNRVAPVVAAVAIVAVGGWMLVGELRRRRDRRAAAHDHQHDREPAESHGLGGGHEHSHGGVRHGHGGVRHSHGGVRHSHLPPAGSTVTWRSLGALGLAGGLIPSTSALFILLVSIDVGRPAFGFVLVAVFGLGMALVMTGVGLAIVFARDRLEQLNRESTLARVTSVAPLGAAVLVLGFGVYLTAVAVGASPAL
jgi:ABC-type nickel/cobalt efflux system permease component RcnA